MNGGARRLDPANKNSRTCLGDTNGSLLTSPALPRIREVQADQRGPGAGMAHPLHQLAQARPGTRGERVPGVPQVMDVHAAQTRILGRQWHKQLPRRSGEETKAK
jgi:hypothetical protein